MPQFWSFFQLANHDFRSLLPQISSDPTSSSSRMRVMNHNWSATKQRLHAQSVAKISRHSVLSVDSIWQCEISSGSCHEDTHQCLSRHFLLQALQCPCSVQKRFSRDVIDGQGCDHKWRIHNYNISCPKVYTIPPLLHDGMTWAMLIAAPMPSKSGTTHFTW